MELAGIRKYVIDRLILNSSGYVNARESAKLDFKESFIWGDYREDYAKTMVSYANAHGGLIIFGVKDKPRMIEGLKSDNFKNTTPETITEFLKSSFSSIPVYEMEELEVSDSITVGWIYVYEHAQKPIVCTKSINKILKDGDIYYRNGARSERISSSQLLAMIDQRLEQNRKLWMQHVEKMTKIGVENTAILNVESGDLSGSGGSVIIDEALLDKIKFIKEGQFVEKEGSPALRIVGDIEGAGVFIQKKIDPEIEYQYSSGTLAEELGFNGNSNSNAQNGAALVKYYDLQGEGNMYTFSTGRGKYKTKKYSQKVVDFLKEKMKAGEFVADKSDVSMHRIRKAANKKV